MKGSTNQYKTGDMVVIIVDHPVGANSQVRGLIGIITDIDRTRGGRTSYRVKTRSSAFIYYADEFRKATNAEIRNTLADILRK